MKPKIIITVENGKIVGASSNMDIKIIVNNYDEDENNQISEIEPGPIFKDGEAHKMYIRVNPPLVPSEVLIKEHLRDIKF
jgi:hypothetical protein